MTGRLPLDAELGIQVASQRCTGRGTKAALPGYMDPIRSADPPVLAPSLDGFASLDWSDEVSFANLAPHDRLVLETRNSIYELIVVDPAAGAALIRGGSFFPTFTHVTVAGSSLGGGFLKLRTVCVGLQLELTTKNLPVITTPVQRVAVQPTSDRVM